MGSQAKGGATTCRGSQRTRTASRIGRRVSLVPVATIAGVCVVAAHSAAAQTPPRTVQPGAPGEPTTVLDADELAPGDLPGHTEADVRFMQGMIPHHAQALDMAALVADRTSDEQMHRLAQRITISQTDEIALMERWLEGRGEAIPTGLGHDGHTGEGHEALMPGMLTTGQMEGLAAATGLEFERLFLEYMIHHHQGALTMVAELLASPGAAQESSIFTFASDVDADQEMEIRRMRRMLEERR